jgi:hypothetical protein
VTGLVTVPIVRLNGDVVFQPSAKENYILSSKKE